MSVVRPEFGPTLPELLGPRVRAWPRAARWAAAALCALAVLGLGWALLVRGGAAERTVVRGPIAFNLTYTSPLHRVPPRGGELLRLQTSSRANPQSYTVRTLRIPEYRGDVNATLAVMASQMVDRMAATIPGFVYRGDGRTRVNLSPGYQILYQARIGGRLTYAKRIMLVPGDEAHPRKGADIDLRAARSPVVPNVDSVGANGVLKTPLRSFRFGIQGP